MISEFYYFFCSPVVALLDMDESEEEFAKQLNQAFSASLLESSAVVNAVEMYVSWTNEDIHYVMWCELFVNVGVNSI